MKSRALPQPGAPLLGRGCYVRSLLVPGSNQVVTMRSAAGPAGRGPGMHPAVLGPDPRTVPFPLLQGKELLAQKLPLWQQACADPGKIADRAAQLVQQMVSSNGALSASKSSLVISDPIPGAKPLPVPPELAPFVGVSPRPPENIMGVGGLPPLAGRPCWGRGALHAGLAGPGPPATPRPCRPLSTAAVCSGQRAHHEWHLGPGQRGLQPLG